MSLVATQRTPVLGLGFFSFRDWPKICLKNIYLYVGGFLSKKHNIPPLKIGLPNTKNESSNNFIFRCELAVGYVSFRECSRYRPMCQSTHLPFRHNLITRSACCTSTNSPSATSGEGTVYSEDHPMACNLQVVNNHGDRKSPSRGCGNPSKWPKWLVHLYMSVTNHLLNWMILQT